MLTLLFGGSKSDGNGKGVAVPLWIWIVLAVLFVFATAMLCYFLYARGRREAASLKTTEEAAEQQRELHAQQLNQLKTVTPLATLLELSA
ncbi:hypothetical protein [Streptomyces xanthochromogenes]|uniref:hypothetical protein n=1 Tax=Streptomyces xanthochromogenes TaxID=67384 RepID=UPI00382061E9